MFALVAISSAHLPPSLGVAGSGVLTNLPCRGWGGGLEVFSIAGGAMTHVPAWAGLEEFTYGNSEIFPNRLCDLEWL